MDMLRLSLIVVGILIVAGVYWWSRRDTTSVAKPPLPRMPLENIPEADATDSAEYLTTNASFDTVPLADTDLQSYGQIVPGRESADTLTIVTPSQRPAAEVLHATTSGEQLIISLTIIGHHGKRFTGEAILQAMHELNLLHGDMRIFHYFAAESTRVAVLSVANIMEPGIFELDKMRAFETPGLVVFLRLPGPQEARAALETLLTISRGLAERLQGDLCDESRNVLTPQSIGYLREKVEAFRFKQKMSQLGTKTD